MINFFRYSSLEGIVSPQYSSQMISIIIALLGQGFIALRTSSGNTGLLTRILRYPYLDKEHNTISPEGPTQLDVAKMSTDLTQFSVIYKNVLFNSLLHGKGFNNKCPQASTPC